jgi:hypothetical protein
MRYQSKPHPPVYVVQLNDCGGRPARTPTCVYVLGRGQKRDLRSSRPSNTAPQVSGAAFGANQHLVARVSTAWRNW